MEFKEKNRIIGELASLEFIIKDRELLESNFPGHELLSRCAISSRQATLDNEILYVLMNKLSPEEIINHRFGVSSRKEEILSSDDSQTPSENPDTSKKKSQKKRSTPKSTGQTSRTKTSKKQS